MPTLAAEVLVTGRRRQLPLLQGELVIPCTYVFNGRYIVIVEQVRQMTYWVAMAMNMCQLELSQTLWHSSAMSLDRSLRARMHLDPREFACVHTYKCKCSFLRAFVCVFSHGFN